MRVSDQLGTGPDRVRGGPSACWGGRETVALVERLHQFDVMRANKAPFAWGLEPRVPFLDKAFLGVSMGIDPAAKMARHFPGLRVSFRHAQNLLPCRSDARADAVQRWCPGCRAAGRRLAGSRVSCQSRLNGEVVPSSICLSLC